MQTSSLKMRLFSNPQLPYHRKSYSRQLQKKVPSIHKQQTLSLFQNNWITLMIPLKNKYIKMNCEEQAKMERKGCSGSLRLRRSLNGIKKAKDRDKQKQIREMNRSMFLSSVFRVESFEISNNRIMKR